MPLNHFYSHFTLLGWVLL